MFQLERSSLIRRFAVIGAIAERRIAMLIDTGVSRLPPFLTSDAGPGPVLSPRPFSPRAVPSRHRAPGRDHRHATSRHRLTAGQRLHGPDPAGDRSRQRAGHGPPARGPAGWSAGHDCASSECGGNAGSLGAAERALAVADHVALHDRDAFGSGLVLVPYRSVRGPVRACRRRGRPTRRLGRGDPASRLIALTRTQEGVSPRSRRSRPSRSPRFCSSA